MDDIRQEIERLVEDGYIEKDGKPIKCVKCKSREFEMVDEHYCQYGLEEYTLKCRECDRVVGHWAYGYWQV